MAMSVTAGAGAAEAGVEGSPPAEAEGWGLSFPQALSARERVRVNARRAEIFLCFTIDSSFFISNFGV